MNKKKYINKCYFHFKNKSKVIKKKPNHISSRSQKLLKYLLQTYTHNTSKVLINLISIITKYLWDKNCKLKLISCIYYTEIILIKTEKKNIYMVNEIIKSL